MITIRIVCPSCKKTARIDEPKMHQKPHCPECGLVLPDVIFSHPIWYYLSGKRKSGPVSLTQLIKLVSIGKLHFKDMIVAKDSHRWIPVDTVLGVRIDKQPKARNAPPSFPPQQTAKPLPPLAPSNPPSVRMPQPQPISQPVVGDIRPIATRDQTTRPPRRATSQRPRRSIQWARVGSVFALVVLLGTALLLARLSRHRTPNQPKSGPNERKPSTTKKTLKELFAQLSPAVPLVMAIDRSHGSGFLLRHNDRFLVITNRHVIENASKGITVCFLKRIGTENKPILTIGPDENSVTAVHSEADLAIIDVSRVADKIRQRKIAPLKLAPMYHVPQVGEEVFAIGHPVDEKGGFLLNSLSDGIVSATGREYLRYGRAIQISVPINPGNSGGPLFDDEGRVVGVATYGFFKARDGRALEALKFAIECRYIHELLQDQSKSLSTREIAMLLKSPKQKDEPIAERVVKQLLLLGYEPYCGNWGKATWRFVIPALSQNRWAKVDCSPGTSYVLQVIGDTPADVDLYVCNSAGAIIARKIGPHSDPGMQFQVPVSGAYCQGALKTGQ